MAKRKVALFGFHRRYATFDDEATQGARVGANLLWPDGTTVQEAEIRNDSDSGSSSTVVTNIAVLWRNILEIPSNIVNLAALATNPAKWLATKDIVSAGEIVTIDTDYQLILNDHFTIEAGGVVNMNGDLAIL